VRKIEAYKPVVFFLAAVSAPVPARAIIPIFMMAAVTGIMVVVAVPVLAMMVSVPLATIRALLILLFLLQLRLEHGSPPENKGVSAKFKLPSTAAAEACDGCG
jgi:hypothetical protein